MGVVVLVVMGVALLVCVGRVLSNATKLYCWYPWIRNGLLSDIHEKVCYLLQSCDKLCKSCDFDLQL